MSKERGRWTLTTPVEPNEIDLEHIAQKIKGGYTQGEICENGDEEDETGECRW